MIVFDKLWTVLEQRNITVYMLNRKYSISRGQIDRLKHNQNVTTDTLNRLCEILDCKLCEIAEYIPQKRDSK